HMVVVMALLAAFSALTGGLIPKTLSSKLGIQVTLFTGVLILSLPFSSWKGGSVSSFMDTWLKSYIAFVLTASLIFTVEQFRRTVFVLSVATVGVIYIAFHATKMNDDGRLSVTYGSLGNSNDLAATLLLGLPFILYAIVDKKRAAFIRILFVGLVGILLILIVRTGSRACLLVLSLMAVLAFFKASGSNKIKVLVLSAVMACVFPFIVSQTLLDRYKTMFTDKVQASTSEEAASAIESTNARKQLMRNALELTVRNPIFGVGIGNFAMKSAELEIANGRAPLWFTAHDVYLLISSETGVICLSLYLSILFFSFKILFSIQRAARREPELAEVGKLAYAVSMSIVAFAACGIFSTNAYNVQLPILAGLTAALERISKPLIVAADARRMQNFRDSIPITPGRFSIPSRPVPASVAFSR
ncbi:MAG: O-antigen ligase family protein, partial [Acidobacteriota bacterium]|nr:O-antigen ligase family protein [Acidobacteriota bacterium]